MLQMMLQSHLKHGQIFLDSIISSSSGISGHASNDFEAWPDIPDDEEMIESRNENESESVIVPGLG